MTEQTAILPNGGSNCGTPGFVHTGGHSDNHGLSDLVLSGHVTDGASTNLKAVYDASNGTRESIERSNISGSVRELARQNADNASDLRKEMGDMKLAMVEANFKTETLIRDQKIADLRAQLACQNQG